MHFFFIVNIDKFVVIASSNVIQNPHDQNLLVKLVIVLFKVLIICCDC